MLLTTNQSNLIVKKAVEITITVRNYQTIKQKIKLKNRSFAGPLTKIKKGKIGAVK